MDQLTNPTLSLSDKKWKEFYFTEIFDDIQRGKRLTKAQQSEGNLPYVSSTAANNGVDGFVGNTEKVRIFENCISLANSGSVGSAFFQSYSFVASDHVTKLKANIDKHAYLFMLPIINRLAEKYSFNREINDERIKREKLLLPVTDEGRVDFEFMSAFSKRLEDKLLSKITEHLSGKLISSLIIRGSLSQCKWKEFYFTEIFDDIQRGKRLTKAQQSEGNLPYVSSTAANNGVDGFVGNTEKVRIFENCISLANSGSVGSAFFQSYSFVASDHVTKLKANIDKHAYLFMLPIINRLAEKYSFNREINDERIKREKLLLPVTDEGRVDFEFMSAFSKSLELDTLKKTLKIYSQHIDNQTIIKHMGG